MARMEQRMYHIQELCYEKLREKLEEDNLLEWRPMDLINLSRVMTESYSAIKKARSMEKPERFEPVQPLTNEEMEILFGCETCSNRGYDKRQGAAEDAGAALPQDADSEDHNGL